MPVLLRKYILLYLLCVEIFPYWSAKFVMQSEMKICHGTTKENKQEVVSDEQKNGGSGW